MGKANNLDKYIPLGVGNKHNLRNPREFPTLHKQLHRQFLGCEFDYGSSEVHSSNRFVISEKPELVVILGGIYIAWTKREQCLALGVMLLVSGFG